jgi:hypothetical protein
MNIFNVKDGELIVEAELLTIPEFKKIWDWDRAASKSYAMKELSIVYHMADINSPYSSYPESKRFLALRDDILKNDTKYVLRLKEAVAKYKELNETPSERSVKELRETLESMRNIISVFRDNIEKKLKESDLDEVVSVNRNGTVVTKLNILNANLKDLLDNAARMPRLIEQLSELEEKIKLNKAVDSGKVRGNKEIGMFEE